MTTNAFTTGIGPLTVPSDADAAAARTLGDRLDGTTPARLSLGGEMLDLPPFALDMLRRGLSELGRGNAVTVSIVSIEAAYSI